MPAELVLTNGRIYTLDECQPAAEAIALWGGRILAVGEDAAISSLVGPGTRVVDLRGRTVIPGLIDAHLHLLGFGLAGERVELRGVLSLEEALARVGAAVGLVAAGDWVLGGGWDRNLWGGLPTRWELDRVAPANPVVLSSKDGHVQWANSLALEVAGVNAETVGPPGGQIVVDPGLGQPTGVLLESAGRLVLDAVPPPSLERCEAALLRALRVAASKGLVGVQTFEGSRTFVALQRLRARGALDLRVCCHLWREGLPEALRLGVRTGFGDEWLRVGHLKLFLDGTLGSQTAYMLEPYAGSESRGILAMPREEFLGLVLEAVGGSIAPAVHAIGDGANRLALEVFEETADLWRAAGLRPRIEHAQLLHPRDLPRLGGLGVIASMQPGHAPSDRPVAEHHWAGRTEGAYAWRSLLDSGAVLAFGSDCPVEPIDPLLGLHAATTRQGPDGQPPGGWHPEQRLAPLEALRAYTLGAAYASGEEALKGSLASGKVADLVVLSKDPFAGPPELFLETRAEATVVGGRVVYGEP